MKECRCNLLLVNPGTVVRYIRAFYNGKHTNLYAALWFNNRWRVTDGTRMTMERFTKMLDEETTSDINVMEWFADERV